MCDLISIVVPVYNVEKFIVKCLDSIIHQTYRNLQIILVDDGSSDHSGAICDQYQNKDVLLFSKSGKGTTINIHLEKNCGRMGGENIC